MSLEAEISKNFNKSVGTHRNRELQSKILLKEAAFLKNCFQNTQLSINL